MNLFRSEEHVQNWSLYDPNTLEGIMPLSDWLAIFSTEGRKHLLDADYIFAWRPKRGQERDEVLARLGKTGPFWQQA